MESNNTPKEKLKQALIKKLIKNPNCINNFDIPNSHILTSNDQAEILINLIKSSNNRKLKNPIKCLNKKFNFKINTPTTEKFCKTALSNQNKIFYTAVEKYKLHKTQQKDELDNIKALINIGLNPFVIGLNGILSPNKTNDKGFVEFVNAKPLSSDDKQMILEMNSYTESIFGFYFVDLTINNLKNSYKEFNFKEINDLLTVFMKSYPKKSKDFLETQKSAFLYELSLDTLDIDGKNIAFANINCANQLLEILKTL